MDRFLAVIVARGITLYPEQEDSPVLAAFGWAKRHFEHIPTGFGKLLLCGCVATFQRTVYRPPVGPVGLHLSYQGVGERKIPQPLLRLWPGKRRSDDRRCIYESACAGALLHGGNFRQYRSCSWRPCINFYAIIMDEFYYYSDAEAPLRLASPAAHVSENALFFGVRDVGV